MADGLEDDREATPNFSIHRGSSKLDEGVVRSKGGISADIRFRPSLSISPALFVSSPAINIK